MAWRFVVAKETGDKELTDRLIARFEPLFTTESHLQPKPNHVDNNVFGALPLELYLQTGEERYRTLGMKYAGFPVDIARRVELRISG